jgi:hypothetical protein
MTPPAGGQRRSVLTGGADAPLPNGQTDAVAASRARVRARRVIVAGVVVAQAFFVARGYWSDHKEYAFQMFPESSTWRADIVRVLPDGRRAPIDEPWSGYRWDDLVRDRGLRYPSVRHHADAGVDNQLAFLREALAYVATHTPRDHTTRYFEARVTYWHNEDAPRVVVYRSPRRDRS